MNFGQALEQLRAGNHVTRTGWNGKGMWLCFIEGWSINFDPDPGYRLQPFIAMKTTANTIVPWLASQTDLLADDWELHPQ